MLVIVAFATGAWYAVHETHQAERLVSRTHDALHLLPGTTSHEDYCRALHKAEVLSAA